MGMGATALTLAPPVLPSGYRRIRRAGTGDEEADELPGDLVAVTVSPSVAQHGQVGAHVGDGQRLAEDVGPFEVGPFDGGVAGSSSVAGGRLFG